MDSHSWYGLLVADRKQSCRFCSMVRDKAWPSTISISKADSSLESSQRKSPVTDGETHETARSRSFAQAPRLHHNHDGLTAHDSQEDFIFYPSPTRKPSTFTASDEQELSAQHTDKQDQILDADSHSLAKRRHA